MSNARNLANVISGNYDIPAGSLDNAVPADGSITVAKLSATGTPSSSTYLRGDGAWAAAGGSVYVQTFNASGTWTKPSTGSMARIQVWGGGGGAGRSNSDLNRVAGGGGGGGYNELWIPLSSLSASYTVTVGAGGAGRTGSAGAGSAGGTSSFGTLVYAYGGGGGYYDGGYGSAGGTALATGETNNPNNYPNELNWGGGPGAYPNASSAFPSSTSSVYGGGGGASGMIDGSYGRSVYGGNGGNRNTAGTVPGGGGGGSSAIKGNGSNGASGRVVVTVW